MEPIKATIVPKKKPPKKPKRIWDNYQEVGEVQKSDSIKFVIAAAIRDGVRYINIREFYLRKKDGVWRPGRDGITVPIKIPIKKGTEIIQPYYVFNKVLHETTEILATMELFDEAKAVFAEVKNED